MLVEISNGLREIANLRKKENSILIFFTFLKKVKSLAAVPCDGISLRNS